MKTTMEALMDGFEFVAGTGIFSFKFGEKNEYELTFEPLMFDNQIYVALYKNQELLTNKVVVKPGYQKKDL